MAGRNKVWKKVGLSVQASVVPVAVLIRPGFRLSGEADGNWCTLQSEQ